MGVLHNYVWYWGDWSEKYSGVNNRSKYSERSKQTESLILINEKKRQKRGHKSKEL